MKQELQEAYMIGFEAGRKLALIGEGSISISKPVVKETALEVLKRKKSNKAYMREYMRKRYYKLKMARLANQLTNITK